MCQNSVNQDSINRREGRDSAEEPRWDQVLARVISRSLAEFGAQRMTPDLQRRIVDRAVALYAIRDELV